MNRILIDTSTKGLTLVLLKEIRWPTVSNLLAISEPNSLIYVPFETNALKVI